MKFSDTMTISQQTAITWHLLTGAAGQLLPDSDTTVLVYDEDLADTVPASIHFVMGDGNNVVRIDWLDAATGQVLPKPAWWADVPFPEDTAAAEIKFPAICIAHTPNGPTNCCEDHAKKVVGLFNFMGAHVHLEPLSLFDGGRECDNCLNEAKKEKV